MTHSTHANLLRKALHSADWPAVEKLIQTNPDADLYNFKLPCGQTPLQLTSLLGASHIVHQLLQLGIPAQDYMAQVYAARNGHANVLRLLVPTKPPHDKTESCTCEMYCPSAGAALHWAAWHAHEACVETLLEGLCEKARDKALRWTIENGGSSLHAAALSGNARLVSVLLNAGSSVLWKDKQGLRAVDLARRFTVATGKGSEVVKMLVEAESELENRSVIRKVVEIGVNECTPCGGRSKVGQTSRGEVCHAV